MKFFIFCPAGAETGGVEALHQLYKAIEAEGETVYMVYVGDNAIDDDPNWYDGRGYYIRDCAAPERYRRSYGEFVNSLESPAFSMDEPDSVCIFPDIWQKAGVHLKHALPCVWMLAAYELEDCWNEKRLLPLAQSHHALDLLFWSLQKGNSTPIMLTDYLTDDFVFYDGGMRRRDVAYYGGRGAEAAQRILGDDVKGFRIFGASMTGVNEFLMMSRYFLYPAKQPGMDRMPREAAACGCVVYCLAEGAGAFFEDCPLPDEFRLPTEEALREALLQALSEGDEGYRRRFHDQRYYRKFAREAKPKFVGEVQNFIRTANQLIGKVG